eukprot:SAG11_NODE_301_length_11038_cov_2.312826_14_plen_184_part_00
MELFSFCCMARTAASACSADCPATAGRGDKLADPAEPDDLLDAAGAGDGADRLEDPVVDEPDAGPDADDPDAGAGDLAVFWAGAGAGAPFFGAAAVALVFFGAGLDFPLEVFGIAWAWFSRQNDLIRLSSGKALGEVFLLCSHLSRDGRHEHRSWRRDLPRPSKNLTLLGHRPRFQGPRPLRS